MYRQIIIALLLLQFKAHAQLQSVAIAIENKTIVFSKADCSSDSVYTIEKNEVFFLMESDINSSSWVKVEIARNNLSKSKIKTDNYLTGFIPKSKICIVDSLQKYEVKDVEIKFKIVKADSNKKKLKNIKYYDLEIPLKNSYVVKKMILNWKGKSINQDKIFYNDLFNIAFTEGIYPIQKNDKFHTFRHDDYYYIKQKCSDGAGSYEITWVIKNGFIVQRIINEI